MILELDFFNDNCRKILGRNSFPKTEMSVFDALDWIENHIEDDNDLAPLASGFGRWRNEQGMTIEEIEKYGEVFNIEDSDLNYTQLSNRVSNSKFIWDSNDITDSHRVEYSTNIRSSQCIKTSSNIENSYFVANSSTVTNSSQVAMSERVIDSADVVSCDDIVHCNHIFGSNNLKDCVGVFGCENCQSVYYSLSLRNCDHCLFCDDLDGKSFMLFNEPVEPREWFVIQSIVCGRLKKSLTTDLFKFELAQNRWCGFAADLFEVSMTHRADFFWTLTKEDIAFIETLPNYVVWIFYRITLSPKIDL